MDSSISGDTGSLPGFAPRLKSVCHGRMQSRDATDVAEWQEQIERVLQDTPSIGATVLFWLNLLDELFKGARHRLDELLRASHAGR
jgi:hypothetical protein